MRNVIAAPAGPDDDDDDGILDRCRCACGRVAAIVFESDGDETWCSIKCGCGAFAPASGADRDPR